MLLGLPCEAYFDVLLNRNKYIYIKECKICIIFISVRQFECKV